ncbi:unnamed protein product [Linum tenue]|uniref:Uncharacterized protein n=1 Tax=Linum tenue TaxID=586396 RepID=A0AAV0QNV5_9ROSI|nr:unnamed protein product [Linum tenue]
MILVLGSQKLKRGKWEWEWVRRLTLLPRLQSWLWIEIWNPQSGLPMNNDDEGVRRRIREGRVGGRLRVDAEADEAPSQLVVDRR